MSLLFSFSNNKKTAVSLSAAQNISHMCCRAENVVPLLSSMNIVIFHTLFKLTKSRFSTVINTYVETRHSVKVCSI